MLPKKRRISRKEIPYILSNGRRYNSPSLLLYVVKNIVDKEASFSKFSFSASKKVSPSAVGRNKLRRRGYSIIAQNINKIKPNYLLLFSYKKGSLVLKFSTIKNEVLGLLSSSGVLE